MTQRRLQEAAYQGPALELDRGFYSLIGEDTKSRDIVDEFTIPIRSGQAWDAPAGHVCRISTVDGPQVGDLNLWNRHDPRERFWAARTRQLQAAHVSTFDRLWSTLPFLRPMATIVGDTLSDYGTDPEGGRVHDTLGTRCDPYVSQMLSGVNFDYHCHSNLVRAILPYGLTEFDVHDVLNVFQCTGLNDNDEYFMKTCPCTTRRPLRVLRRAGPACGPVHLPRRRSLRTDVRGRCRRPGGELPSFEGHGLSNRRGPPRRLDRTDFAELSRSPRAPTSTVGVSTRPERRARNGTVISHSPVC